MPPFSGLPLGRTAGLRSGSSASFFRGGAGHFGFGQRMCVLERQTDPLRFGIHRQHLDFDLFAFVDDVRHLEHAVMGQFRDVDQSFDARRQFDEGAELGRPRDDAFHHGIHREPRFDIRPRVIQQVAVVEADLARLAVDLFNLDPDLLTGLQDFAGMRDSIPTELADVNQAVQSADIDKRTKIADAGHGPFADVAHLQFFQQFRPLFFLLTFQQRPMTQDQVAPAFVGLRDHAQQLLFVVLRIMLDAEHLDLAGRDEAPDVPHHALEAADVRARHAGLDDRAFGQIRPVLDIDRRTGHAQLVQAVFGVVPADDDIQLHPQLRRIGKLPQRSDTFVVAVQGKKHVVAVDLDDDPTEIRIDLDLGAHRGGSGRRRTRVAPSRRRRTRIPSPVPSPATTAAGATAA